MYNIFLSIVATLINSVLFKTINKKKSKVYSVKCISLIHSIMSSLGGILHFNDLISFQLHKYIVYYSLGYIAYDLELYTKIEELKKEKMITYFHHLLFYIGISYFPNEPKLYSLLIMTEISTIPLNLMWIYKYEGNMRYFKIYSYIFYVSFFIFRILNCHYIFHSEYQSNDYKKLGCIITFTGLNYYWFYLMTKKLIRHKF